MCARTLPSQPRLVFPHVVEKAWWEVQGSSETREAWEVVSTNSHFGCVRAPYRFLAHSHLVTNVGQLIKVVELVNPVMTIRGFIFFGSKLRFIDKEQIRVFWGGVGLVNFRPVENHYNQKTSTRLQPNDYNPTTTQQLQPDYNQTTTTQLQPNDYNSTTTQLLQPDYNPTTTLPLQPNYNSTTTRD